MRRLNWSYGPTVFCVGMVLVTCHAVSLEDRARSIYAYSDWRDVGCSDYVRLVELSQLSAPVLATNGMAITVDKMVEVNGNRWLAFSGTDLKMAIETRVHSSVGEAHASMIEILSGSSSTIPYARMTNMVGDVAFRYPRQMGAHWVFSRNNVSIDIVAHDDLFNITNIARQIDASLLRVSRGDAE